MVRGFLRVARNGSVDGVELYGRVGEPARNLADVTRVGVIEMRAVAVDFDLSDPGVSNLVEQIHSQGGMAKQICGDGSMHSHKKVNSG